MNRFVLIVAGILLFALATPAFSLTLQEKMDLIRQKELQRKEQIKSEHNKKVASQQTVKVKSAPVKKTTLPVANNEVAEKSESKTSPVGTVKTLAVDQVWEFVLKANKDKYNLLINTLENNKVSAFYTLSRRGKVIRISLLEGDYDAEKGTLALQTTDHIKSKLTIQLSGKLFKGRLLAEVKNERGRQDQWTFHLNKKGNPQLEETFEVGRFFYERREKEKAEKENQTDIATIIENGQIWSGYYLCGEKKITLNLKIVDINSGNIQAIFDYNSDGVIGAYKLSGGFKKETKSLLLNPTEWILQPPNYVMVGMTGELNSSNQMVGSILYKGCSKLQISLQDDNIELFHVAELQQKQKQLEKEREEQKQRQAEYESSLPEVLVFGEPLHTVTKDQLKKVIEKAGGKLTHDLPEKNFMQFDASQAVPGVKHIVITYTNDYEVSSYAYMGISQKTAEDIFKTLRAKYGQADTQGGFAHWYCRNNIKIEYQFSEKSLAQMNVLNPEMDIVYITEHFKQYSEEEMLRKRGVAKKDSEARKGNQAF